LGRHQFEAYLDKVYDFSERVRNLPEGRLYPRHPWKQVFDAVFLGAALQFASLHQIEAECRRGALARRIGPLSEDCLGYALERQDPAALFALGCELSRRLKRNGVLRSDWARGLIVAAVDGTEICSSFVRCCQACMERTVKRKVGEEFCEEVQFYHRIVVVTIVSTPFPIPLGLRFQKQGEGEVACALTLLEDLIDQLGRRFFDLLVADALYLQKPFVEAIEALGLDWVLTLKENQPELLAEAQRLTAGPADFQHSDSQQDLQLWHAPDVDWPAANRSIRVVKTVRNQKKNGLRVTRDQERNKRHVRETRVEQSTNFYASNFVLGSIPPLFLHQVGRSRWSIDVEVFQTITTEGHLKKPSVHQRRGRALVVLTMIRLLAYTLTLVFYHRQVRSHFRNASFGFCELARRLAYRFVSEPPDTS
jgi:Transposase DDE domain